MSVSLRRRSVERLRDPEVEHLHAGRAVGAAGEEQVRRLEVAVHDAGRVRLGDGLARLEHVVDRLLERQRPALAPALAARSRPSRYSITMYGRAALERRRRRARARRARS